MGLSFKRGSRKPVRSVSLPCSSHPNTDRMEILLNKVNEWQSTLTSSKPSADIICSGYSQLTALYECLKDIFSANHTMKWTDDLLDVSVMLLDICSNTSDVISDTKQNVRDLRYDLRRNCSSKSIVTKYIEFRNKLKKDIKRSIASLKQVNNMIHGFPLIVDSENDHQMCIRVFREVTAFSIFIFRLLLEFLAFPCLGKRRAGRWSAVSGFLSNGKVVPEEIVNTTVNELQCLDAALLRYYSSDKQEFIQVVSKNLEALEDTLERINSYQHSLSRRLIQTRASILNMVSFN